MLDADAFAIRSARKNVPSAEVFHVAGWPKGADALTKRGKCARETNTRVTVGIAATIPILARSRHDLAGGCATIGSSRIRPCTAASRTTSPYCRSPTVVVLILHVARCVVSVRARAWAGASAVLAAVVAAAAGVGYVVVAVADADTWRAPASASQWRPVDRRPGAGAPAGYSHAILSAKYLGELQVPVGRLLALGGRFGWVRAEPSGDGRFVVWSAGRKSAGSETAARDSAAAVARAAIAESRVKRGRKKRKRSAVT